MTRDIAEKKLKEVFGLEKFYDEQWETISRLLKGERILLIERTGYGKSLCYQFPAIIIDGLTIIFSPLIALMRDQVNKLNELGIDAKFINSEQSQEENDEVLQEAIEGKLKILYIAPERQENQEWIEATKSMDLSMVVIDEAHTISVWGHDFRPSFRRIVNLVRLLPENMPVLATTATATERVQKDIENQISGNLKTIRGKLLRDNFLLFVIETNSENEKLLWLAENLNNIPGSGLIYTGTRVNTEVFSRWLNYNNMYVTDYNAGFDGETRKEIEKGFIENRWKAIVSTNALGMGIDKPDIRFVIHTQIPASPIHYYQEIGRAGRDGEKTYIILFYNSKKDNEGIPIDYKLPKAFIDGGRPSVKKYHKVIEALQEEPLSSTDITKAANLKSNQARVIIADLIDQGIIKKVNYGRRKFFEYQFDAPPLDTIKFENLRKAKLNDLNSMVDYIYTREARMKYLCEYLGDKHQKHFNNCDNTKFKKRSVKAKKSTIDKLQNFWNDYYPELHVATKKSNLINGFASSFYGVSNVGQTIHRCKYEDGANFPDFLLKLTLKVIREKIDDHDFDIIVYVPPTKSGNLVKDFAKRLSISLKIPLSHNLTKKKKTEPQKVFQNNALKRNNVNDVFHYENANEINEKIVLLVDDVLDSGATIKEIGKLLTDLGAKIIVPVVIAKTVGGDI